MKLLRPNVPKVLLVGLGLTIVEGIEMLLVGISTCAASSLVNLTISYFQAVSAKLTV